VCEDPTGNFVRIGCKDTSYWFCVAVGKTEKQTLSSAKMHLQHIAKVKPTFEYIENRIKRLRD